METKKIKSEKDANTICMTVAMYKFFLAHGKTGRLAKSVWEHLLFTVRIQENNQVWANDGYIKKGLELGQKTVEQAKSFLARHGLIEYVRERKKDGTHGKVYIKVKMITTPLKTTTVDNHGSGSEKEIPLKQEKYLYRKGKDTGLAAGSHNLSDNRNGQRIHKRIQLAFEDLHGEQFSNYGKEGVAIKKLISNAKRLYPGTNPETTILFMAGVLKWLKESRRERFWRDVVVSPSMLLSRWDQVYDIARTEHKDSEAWKTTAGVLS